MPGKPQRKWTAGELRRLRAMAGAMPTAVLARKLGRSPSSVEHMARRLGLSLAYRDFGERPCPSCGRMRFTVDRSGKCAPCRHAERLETIKARMAEVVRTMPADRRGVYAATESSTGRSRVDPMPPRPDTSGRSARAAAGIEAGWRRECEAVEAANAMRLMRAAERRLERMEISCKKEKSGENDFA